MPGRMRKPMALRRQAPAPDAPPATARAVPVISHNAWAVVIAMLVFTLAAFQLVRTRHAAVQIGYALSQANRERDQLLEDQRKLRLEVATLKNPVRLRSLAQSLGLVEPDPARIVRLGRAAGRLALDAARGH